MTPTRKLLWLFAALLAFALALPWLPLLAWWLVLAAVLLAVLADAVLGWRVPVLRAERSVAGVWPIGRWGDVALVVRHTGGRTLRLALFDHYPSGWGQEGLPHPSTLSAGQFVRFVYRVQPQARGDHRFGRLEARVASPLGLWWRRAWLGAETPVKVFPDFAPVLKRSLLAADRLVPQAGVIRRRRRGEGTDFHQLRDYREGDALRAIDWKATARLRKPISREYQEERDQQIIFLLDCGRRMQAQDGDTSHFDHALNAMLVLAWLAQKQGDAIGLYTFGGEERWLPPLKGRASFDRLLSSLYDLEASETHPDYLAAAEALAERAKKRALVVLLTNLRDEDSDSLADAMTLLVNPHRVLCASLRETVLDSELLRPVADFEAALTHCGTLEYLEARRKAFNALSGHGRELIDVTPQALPLALVNRYREMKEGGVL
ncbi:Uncharacterized conserved protein, DUF58 family, contains vWF domain [Andreprevotia lacus DSM 23236]|jgi:uncharacterized protein (DUF58 family)|uniref:Uncharacterized conserved protein, DUF58 family, contains vWF domain n=1 Tax=Andreprevotia lacus DSM 23236 TaxID=1121001 RepID=A0A1W1XTA4_9NEIS|nr:DUF58 domain-containing protein [Andreprevotia lacus]SMC27075.1 Uncharacterized conserved protein, DUF58 family, contains vWF domain [Andreprevotia lacus DSM 23236]